jgi:predicted ester cyclase
MDKPFSGIDDFCKRCKINGETMKKLYMILSLALILCFMVGCQDKEAMAELEEFRAQAAVEEQNAALIRNFLKEIDAGNWDMFKVVLADEYKLYFPSNAPAISKEEQIAMVNSNLKSFPKWQHEIKDLIAKGDKVVVHIIDKTTNEGEFQGIPATGKKVEFGNIIIFRIKDGKIIEAVQEADVLGWMMQLGMELKPK